MTERYPWFRFYNETRTDIKISKVCRLSGQPKVVVMGAWATLLCFAGSSPERGKLLINEDTPITLDDIVFDLGIDDEIGQSLIDAFIVSGLLALEDDTYVICKWDNRQYESDYSRDRVRKHRAKKAVEVVKEEPPPSDLNGSDSDIDRSLPETLQEHECNVTVTPLESDSINSSDSRIAPAHEVIDFPDTGPPIITDSEFALINQHFKNNGFFLGSSLANEVNGIYDEINPPPNETKSEWFIYAIDEAMASCNRPQWRMVRKILLNISDEGSLALHQANWTKEKRKNGGKNGQARTGKGKSRPNGKAGGGQGTTSLTDSYLANNADNIARKLDALHRS